MKSIKQMWRAWAYVQRAKAAAKREKALVVESQQVINVIEFEGQFYIACNGTPVVPFDSLKWDEAQTLISARQAYIEYRKNNEL